MEVVNTSRKGSASTAGFRVFRRVGEGCSLPPQVSVDSSEVLLFCAIHVAETRFSDSPVQLICRSQLQVGHGSGWHGALPLWPALQSVWLPFPAWRESARRARAIRQSARRFQ
jgi:hypothetical protein